MVITAVVLLKRRIKVTAKENYHEKVKETKDESKEEKISKTLREIEPHKRFLKAEVVTKECFIKEDLLTTYAEQKGNTCGSSSVSTCINYLL